MSSRSRALVGAGIMLACAGCLNAPFDAQREAAPLPEDFALAVKPAALTLAPGDTASIALAISRGAGAESTVAFSVTGLPAGVTSNAQGLVAAAGSASDVLTLSAAIRATLSSTPIVVHASDGRHEHAATIDLVVRGAAGTIDRGFGDGGVTTTPLTGDVTPPELLLASDGGIVLGAGVSDPDGGRLSFALVRYTDDGVIDPTFGSGGIVTTLLPAGASAAIRGLAEVPANGLVATGSAGTATFAARYDQTGQLAVTFGTQGIARIDGVLLVSSSALVRASGAIVVAGSSPAGHPAILQFLASGAIDTSFADGGLATDPAVTGSLHGAALGLDGGVVGVGFGRRQPPGLVDFLASGTPGTPTVSADYACGSFGDVARADDGYRAAVGSAYRQCFFRRPRSRIRRRGSRRASRSRFGEDQSSVPLDHGAGGRSHRHRGRRRRASTPSQW